MKIPKITKEELQKTGYVYLGEYGGHTTECIANQLWRSKDELIIYDPEEEQVVRREYNEPRYQTISDYRSSLKKR